MEDVVVSSDLRHKIRLCFQEAVTNAVVHGNQYDENKKVCIQVEQRDDKLIFLIKDEGSGFDLRDTVHPLADENIEKQGGRGVFLMKEFSGNCDYCIEEKLLRMEFIIE